MLDRLRKFDRYKDYISISSWEVRASLTTTIVVLCVFVNFIYLYEDFDNYVSIICDIVLCIIGAEFGLLGIILAGIGIIVGLISKEVYLAIKSINQEIIPRLMSQYEFCAVCLVVQIVYFSIIPIMINSKAELPDRRVFYGIVFFLVYHLFFNIYYILALLGNCIRFIEIKNKIYNVKEIEKTTIDIANEIRIELLMSEVLKGMEKSELLYQLELLVDLSSIDGKDEIKQYFRDYYQ